VPISQPSLFPYLQQILSTLSPSIPTQDPYTTMPSTLPVSLHSAQPSETPSKMMESITPSFVPSTRTSLQPILPSLKPTQKITLVSSLDMLLSFIVDSYASRRPDIEREKMTPAYWLGFSTTDMKGNKENRVTSKFTSQLQTCPGAREIEYLDKKRQKRQEQLESTDDKLIQLNMYLTAEEELEVILEKVQLYFKMNQTIWRKMSREEELVV
jgi:hypothetical protein